jgi:DNA processing protein
MQDELLYRVALTMIPKVGAVTARALLSHCGSAEAVFKTDKRGLCRIPGIGEVIADQVLHSRVLEGAERNLRLLEERGVKPLFYLDPAYPSRLRHWKDSPVMLYYQGNADLNAARTVALVGTRKPSHYGIAVCEELVSGLGSLDVLIISGLAFGIDIVAHRKCVEEGIPTVAALAHGLDRIYPVQHQQVAKNMLVRGGLLSEFPFGVMPDREHFPMRNRIIAAMSDAVVVIESGESGGSMITAQMANSYHKDVFAVPGRIQDKTSLGCNHLIKTNQAHLLESVADLRYIMRWDSKDGREGVQQTLFDVHNEAEAKMINLLRERATLGIDALIFESGMPQGELVALLLELECRGLIRALPGKRYEVTT